MLSRSKIVCFTAEEDTAIRSSAAITPDEIFVFWLHHMLLPKTQVPVTHRTSRISESVQFFSKRLFPLWHSSMQTLNAMNIANRMKTPAFDFDSFSLCSVSVCLCLCLSQPPSSLSFLFVVVNVFFLWLFDIRHQMQYFRHMPG